MDVDEFACSEEASFFEGEVAGLGSWGGVAVDIGRSEPVTSSGELEQRARCAALRMPGRRRS